MNTGSKSNNNQTVTREDIAQAVYSEIGLSKQESAYLVNRIFEKFETALTNNEVVKLPKFGNFVVRDKTERIGRNPKTGEEALITSRRVVVFKPSAWLKRRIDKALSKT